jgi:hypothetical protein
MSKHIDWKTGGEADLVLLDGDKVELLSTAPFAPGSRPEGTLTAPPCAVFWMKVHRSKKEPDGRFHVWGRLLNMTRDVRAVLKALSGKSSSTGTPESSTLPGDKERTS